MSWIAAITNHKERITNLRSYLSSMSQLKSRDSMASSDIDETRGRLVRSASAITPLTLVSRLTGYLREKVVALLFGASARTDAFIVAWRIPNMLRDIVGEGAMSSAFIPVYAEVLRTQSEEKARAFVGRAIGAFAFLLSALTVAGIILSPVLVDLLAHDFRSRPAQFANARTHNARAQSQSLRRLPVSTASPRYEEKKSVLVNA